MKRGYSSDKTKETLTLFPRNEQSEKIAVYQVSEKYTEASVTPGVEGYIR